MLHLQFYGGHKAVARPDPIPNSAVKHRIADGSACIACARVGSRQTFKSRTSKKSGFLLLKTKVLPETRNSEDRCNCQLNNKIIIF